jgi:hypothetical protein
MTKHKTAEQVFDRRSAAKYYRIFAVKYQRQKGVRTSVIGTNVPRALGQLDLNWTQKRSNSAADFTAFIRSRGPRPDSAKTYENPTR